MRPLRPAHGVLVVTAALALAACGGGGSPTVRASGADGATATTTAPPRAAAATATTTPATTTPATTTPAPPPAAAADAAPAAARSVVPASASWTPPPAVIEVRAADADGWHGVANLSGPGGARAASLDDGVAIFDDLGDGVYEVTVTYESDSAGGGSDGVDVGTAFRDLRAGTFGLVAGDRAVVTCSPDSCTAVL